MNDLDSALHATYQARSQSIEPRSLREEVLAIPDLGIAQERRWPSRPRRRFHSMFSPTKFIVAGAIVALFGGFLLIAQPLDQQGASVPGAATGGPGTFSPAGSLAEGREGHTATLLPDGRVLVIGGREWAHGVRRALAEVWDPETASFSPAGSLAVARWHHTATLLPDGRVFVIGGGVSDDDDPALAEVWDPATGTFGPAGAPAEVGGGDSATLLPDGRVLVIGSDNLEGTVTEVWDPGTGTFSPLGSLPQGHGGHTATALPDGRVLVIGGCCFSLGDDEVESFASALVWDPATASFDEAGSLAQARWDHSATLLSDGRVLVIGGMDATSDGHFTSAEVWDPATDAFAPAGSLDAERWGLSTTLLLDGRVLVVGGSGEDDDGHEVLPASAVVWDPGTASFEPAAVPLEQRHGHTATLLPDGRVLIVGGTGATGGNTEAEVWGPSDG